MKLENITSDESEQSWTRLINRAHAFIKSYTEGLDASHDHAHIMRVVALAQKIHAAEISSSMPHPHYSLTRVKLAAMLHDVGDRKYGMGAEMSMQPVARLLTDWGASAELAAAVQAIVTAVSFSKERADPALVANTLSEYPELAIVQDADRLDALGAVGVARAFVYGAVKGDGRGLEGTMHHFDEKLLGLEALMKTCEGRRLAAARTERLRVFKAWWQDEAGEVS
ncbi:MAG: hypothetical protein M1825_001853 [Sarcosagium campestre]|nr:MAG: hypothetical protein M1825_001853 [Sarcosagium campestre]